MLHSHLAAHPPFDPANVRFMSIAPHRPPMTVDRDVAHHTELDARLVEAVGGLRLLGLTSWPAALQASRPLGQWE